MIRPNSTRLSRIGARFAIGVLLVLPTKGAAAAESPPDPCFDSVPVETYSVDMQPAKTSYQPGAVVDINVAVVRPPRDPAGLGLGIEPPVTMPAAGADVIVALKVAGQEYAEWAQTDQQGKASVQIQLPSTAPAGSVPAYGFAWRSVLRLPCVSVEEFGIVTAQDFLSVTR